VVTWFELIGDGSREQFDPLARQFGISSDEARRAFAAFLPAFALGMRNASSRSNPAALMGAMAGNPFAAMWTSPFSAFTPQASDAGRRILDNLFGSDETTRRVAQQAADFAGIGAETMQRMLPLMAGIYAGGLYRMMMQGNDSAAMPANFADAWTARRAPDATETSSNPFMMLMEAVAPQPPRKPPEEPAWARMVNASQDMQEQYLASLQAMFQGTPKR
jgi:hypothetical protein